jgi:hypothetical protein
MFAAAVTVSFLCNGFVMGQARGQGPQQGQGAKSAQVQTSIFKRRPSFFLQQTAALGDRVRITGKELSVHSGDIVDSLGHHSPVRVMYQLNGAVRLEGFNSKGVLSFDSQRATGVTSSSDEMLLEIFLVDSVEGMLNSLEHSAAARLLGTGFGPDPRKTSTYTGPRYDIFEVTAPLPSRVDHLVRTKLYYFDSQSGLLVSTQSYDRSRATPLKLETRFSDWKTVDGSTYAGRIDHYEAGQLVFSFIVSNTSTGSAVGLESFR